MKEIAKRIDGMEKCHGDILEKIDKIENSLEKFRNGGNLQDMKLALDVFLLYMKTTVSAHKKEEEEVLFPFLRSIDHPEKVIDGILGDHEEIHRSVGMLDIIRKMDNWTRDEVESGVRGLVETLREHVKSEDELLKIAREKL